MASHDVDLVRIVARIPEVEQAKKQADGDGEKGTPIDFPDEMARTSHAQRNAEWGKVPAQTDEVFLFK